MRPIRWPLLEPMLFLRLSLRRAYLDTASGLQALGPQCLLLAKRSRIAAVEAMLAGSRSV